MKLREELEDIHPRQAITGLELTIMPTLPEKEGEIISGEESFRQQYTALSHVLNMSSRIFEIAYSNLEADDRKKMTAGMLLGFMAVAKAGEIDGDGEAARELQKLDALHMGTVFVRLVSQSGRGDVALARDYDDKMWEVSPALGMIHDSSYKYLAERYDHLSVRQNKYLRAGVLWAVHLLHEESLMQTEVRDNLEPQLLTLKPESDPPDDNLPRPGPLWALRRNAK